MVRKTAVSQGSGLVSSRSCKNRRNVCQTCCFLDFCFVLEMSMSSQNSLLWRMYVMHVIVFAHVTMQVTYICLKFMFSAERRSNQVSQMAWLLLVRLLLHSSLQQNAGRLGMQHSVGASMVRRLLMVIHFQGNTNWEHNSHLHVFMPLVFFFGA